MASWNDINSELLRREADHAAAIDQLRSRYISELSELRGRNIICYYSGWLQLTQKIEASSITDDDMNGLMNAVHGMDRSKGLDLLLHTPGGDLAATEAIVKYLLSCFDNDVIAIVPQLAMSAGTMIACACKSILMGRQSSLGPTDPQYGGVPAGGVIEEFEHAIRDVQQRPESIPLWAQIIGQYHPTFLGDCQKAVEVSKTIVGDWLRSNMFANADDCESTVNAIVDKLCEHQQSAMHNRHFSYDELRQVGLNVERLEDDDNLQDAVLSVHHAFMTTFQRAPIAKVIESSENRKWIVHVA